jgi:hypothetical protein
MATSNTYYINGPSLGSSTAVFLNANLTTVAPNGFYSDGVISRQQVSGVLLPQQNCPSCATPCGTAITGSGRQGVYLINLNAGDEVSDVGAIIIRFNPLSVPDGIRATFNGVVYNKLTSPVDGFHKTTTPGGFTYIGLISTDCGISGTTYPNLPKFLFNGTTFAPTGETQTITVNPGDVSLGVTAPGSCMIVIPKLTASPSIVNFEFVGPCAGTLWSISINCPVLLTGFSSSVNSETSDAVCALYKTTTYYNASLANTPGTVGLYDFVYSDAYGSTQLAAGFYRASGSIVGGNDWFEVDENGIVIALGFCEAPPENAFCIGVILDSYTCCDAIDAYNNEGCPTAPFPSSAYFYSDCSSLSLGCIMYSDAELLYPITGLSRWIYDGENCWFMDSTGTITEEGTCGGPTYDLYIADVYDCFGCTLTSTGVTVALPSGTVPVYGNYYIKEAPFDGNYYVPLYPTSVGPGIILDTFNDTGCGGC